MDCDLSTPERLHDIYFTGYLLIYSIVYLFNSLSLSQIMHH